MLKKSKQIDTVRLQFINVPRNWIILFVIYGECVKLKTSIKQIHIKIAQLYIYIEGQLDIQRNSTTDLIF